MPGNVRNFWIELDVDGSKSRVETGPRGKDGGFTLVVLMRDSGGIVRALEVVGHAWPDGRLVVDVTSRIPMENGRIETTR